VVLNPVTCTFTQVLEPSTSYITDYVSSSSSSSEAVDKVLHNGLFLKLIKRNIPGSAYNVSVMLMSDAGVKNATWSSFASLVYNVLGF